MIDECHVLHVIISKQLKKDGSKHFATAFCLKAKLNAIHERVEGGIKKNSKTKVRYLVFLYESELLLQRASLEKIPVSAQTQFVLCSEKFMFLNNEIQEKIECTCLQCFNVGLKKTI